MVHICRCMHMHAMQREREERVNGGSCSCVHALCMSSSRHWRYCVSLPSLPSLTLPLLCACVRACACACACGCACACVCVHVDVHVHVHVCVYMWMWMCMCSTCALWLRTTRRCKLRSLNCSSGWAQAQVGWRRSEWWAQATCSRFEL